MKGAACVLVVFVCAALPRSIAASASPIPKVLQMLSSLQAKINAEGTESQKTFAEFTDFCEKRSKELQYEIKSGKGEKLELEADVGKEAAFQKALSAKIEDLAAGIATDEGDLKAATTIRKAENGDFLKEEKELVEVIEMVKHAIGILERETQKGGALVQLTKAGNVVQALNALVQASVLGSGDATKLAALVQNNQQSDDEDAEAAAPAAAAYEVHSENLIATLEGILEKAQDQLSEARKKETASKNNFEMLEQSLKDDIRFATEEMEETKQLLASSKEAKATAEGDLLVTSKDLASDIISLEDMRKDCVTKASDFESTMKKRTEELKALAAAKTALQKIGGAEKVVYGLQQVSLIQISSETELAQFEALRFIRDLARKDGSASLSQLAKRMEAVMHSSVINGQDPFGKVKSLISDMIAKLEDAADADASEKAYCDKELSETRAKKDDKTSKLKSLVNKIDQMSGRSAKLKEEVTELQKGLAELVSAQSELDRLRSKEEQEYTVSKASVEEGLKGVRLALKILSDYYGADNSGNAASIIGLLEVVEGDLSKSLAELIASEESAVSAYKEESTENLVEKASKEADVKFKTREAKQLDDAVAEAESNKAGVQAELEPVAKFLTVIESRCIAKAESYAERSERRKSELQGLKEALSILEGQAVLLQEERKTALRSHPFA